MFIYLDLIVAICYTTCSLGGYFVATSWCFTPHFRLEKMQQSVYNKHWPRKDWIYGWLHWYYHSGWTFVFQYLFKLVAMEAFFDMQYALLGLSQNKALCCTLHVQTSMLTTKLMPIFFDQERFIFLEETLESINQLLSVYFMWFLFEVLYFLICRHAGR